MLLEYALELLRNLADCLVPGYPFEPVSHPLQRVEHSIAIVLMKGDARALPTDISFAPGVIFVRPNFCDPVVFNLDLQTASVAAQYTTRFLPGHALLPPLQLFRD